MPGVSRPRPGRVLEVSKGLGPQQGGLGGCGPQGVPPTWNQAQRASTSLEVTQRTRQRGQWGSAGRGEPPRCPLSLLTFTHMLAQPLPLQMQLTGPPMVRN